MRSEDDALALVYEKAASLRRRRRALTGSAAVLVVAVLAGGLFAVADQDTTSSVRTADRPGSTLPTRYAHTPDPDPGTGEQPAAPVTDAPATDAPAVQPSEPDAGPLSNGTDPADRPDAAPAPEDTPDSPPPAAGSPAPPPPVCDPSMISMTVRTDRDTYQRGDTVAVHAEAVNTSGGDCAQVDTVEWSVSGDDGSVRYQAATAYGTTDAAPWQPGEAVRTTHHWAQETFDQGAGQAPPGTYTVTIVLQVRDPHTGTAADYVGDARFEIAA